jgi:putative transposase
MPNTYTQIYVQTVFAVKHRQGLIRVEWRENLYRYMTGIVQNQGHKLIAVNGMPDHVHTLIGLNPKQSISELVQYLKMDSSKWINNEQLTPGKFEWQTGYGAFSYGQSQIDEVVQYIKNQEVIIVIGHFLRSIRVSCRDSMCPLTNGMCLNR